MLSKITNTSEVFAMFIPPDTIIREMEYFILKTKGLPIK